MELSNFVKNAKFSAIRKMFNESQKMTDVVSFSMGEPDEKRYYMECRKIL